MAQLVKAKKAEHIPVLSGRLVCIIWNNIIADKIALQPKFGHCIQMISKEKLVAFFQDQINSGQKKSDCHLDSCHFEPQYEFMQEQVWQFPF